MRSFIKLIVGLLLLPLCIGAASAVWRLLHASGGAGTVWLPLLVGAGLWGVVYILFPRPMWLYVAGHELTHAVSAWCFGGRVGKINVSSDGGHVELSRTNFVIALSPYFLPVYAMMVVLLFFMMRFVLPWDRLEVWFLGCLGAAYAFHVTLTGHVLRTRQSDITQHGYIFSASIIFVGNMLVLLLGVPLLTSDPSIPTAFLWCWEDTLQLIQSIRAWST